jgi:hypothetical protein
MVSEIKQLHENRSRKGRGEKRKENQLREREGINKLEAMILVGKRIKLEC